MTKNIKILFAVIFSIVLFSGCRNDESTGYHEPGSEWEEVVNLAGDWSFSVGDNPKWATPGFDSENWEKIKVPSSWENQGFHGYDGYAWYRNTFELPEKYRDKFLYLFLGYVDDVDQVFINGKMVGFSGSFPPDYNTAYNIFRRYPVPNKDLNFDGKNTIAVRVYDYELEGGILSGDIGIYTAGNIFQNSVMLIGTWKFNTGDSLAWKNQTYNDSSWKKIIVPAYWENQGYPEYDGYAWYRRTIFIPDKFKDEKMILMLGKIDDLDEAYLNGKLVGSTGKMNNPSDLGDNYLKLRAYYLSKDDIKFGQNNLIAVRVYDGFQDGGIYSGPVAILPLKEFSAYWNSIRDKK